MSTSTFRPSSTLSRAFDELQREIVALDRGRASEDGLAESAAIDLTSLTVGHFLDELSPCVSRADDSLRKTLLEDLSVDDAVAGVARES